MNALQSFFQSFSLLWKFFGFFQTPFLRFWHLLAIVFVVSQLLKRVRTPFIDSWHIELGLLLLPFVCVFLFVSLKRRGFKYFFPYLWGENTQLSKDVQKMLQGGVPTPRPPQTPGGLPGVVQGLGFICFFMTVLCGFTWYLLWEQTPRFSVNFLDLHRYFAYALAVYVLGHGIMALRHFLFWRKNHLAKAHNVTM